MPPFKAVREASEKVYVALGKACTKHSEHLAHFCVNPMYETTEKVSDTQIKFKIAYARIHLAHTNAVPSHEQDEPMWFMIDTVIDSSTGIHTLENCTSNNATGQPSNLKLFQSLKRELDPVAESPPKKPRKSVRFQTLGPSLSLSEASVGEPSIPRLRKDFCDVLRNQLSCQSAFACLGMLHNSGNISYRVYAPPSDWCHRSRQKASLSELISASRNPVGSLSTYEKLHLAKVLAIAVLQYYSTPWLNLAWRSADIFFFDAEGHAEAPKAMNLSSPHINVRVRDLEQTRDPSNAWQPLHRTPSFPAASLAPNAFLFSLGVLLLELAYSSTLQSLQQSCDLEGGRETRYTEFFVAKRLASTTVREMDSTYSRIVKRLLNCDFGCGDDLNDPELQGAFHGDVVCKLARLEQGFRDLQLG